MINKKIYIGVHKTSNPNDNYMESSKLVKNAIKKGLVSGMIAWVDVGYNHGGKTYINPEEFNFTWKYDFSQKIHFNG